MAATLWIIFSIAAIAAGGRLLCDPLLSRVPVSPWLGSVLIALAGLYFASVTYFLSLAAFGAPRLGLAAAEIVPVVVILGAGLVWRRRQIARSFHPAADGHSSAAATGLPSTATLALAAGLAALYSVGFVIRSLKAPQGYLDAIVTWNRGARFLYRDKDHWVNNFDVLVGQFQPDYPLFLQSTIARVWTYLGTDSVVIPAVAAYVFAALSASLLYLALSHLRGRTAAAFALCLLLGSTTFIKSAYDQVADVPIATFILAAMVVLALGERHGLSRATRWALAGAFAGGAAWTKNEGSLFVVALGIGLFFSAGRPWFRRDTIRALFGYLCGAAITLIPVFVLKLVYAPPGYLAAGDLNAVIARMSSGARFLDVLSFMSNQILGLGSLVFAVLVVLALLGGMDRNSAQRETLSTGILTLAALLIGYYLFYMVSPFPLEWHIGTSFGRLLMQLLPAILFLFFASARVPQTLAAGKTVS